MAACGKMLWFAGSQEVHRGEGGRENRLLGHHILGGAVVLVRVRAPPTFLSGLSSHDSRPEHPAGLRAPCLVL